MYKSPPPQCAETLRYFDFAHLPAPLQDVARPVHDVAHRMATSLSGPQLELGLQRLLEAKDCFVRAALTKRR